MRGKTLLGCLLLATPPAARATVTIQDPGTYVVDQAGIMDADTEARLNQRLAELEQKTAAQVKILTVQTIDGEDWFGFVHRHAELWKLGRKGRDNGVLIVVAINERKDRIHVGYGLEGVLPDGWCGTLRRQTFVPNFQQGRFSAGLYEGAMAIAGRIAQNAGVQLAELPPGQFAERPEGQKPPARRTSAPVLHGVCACFWPAMIGLVVLSSLSRRRRYHSRWGGGGMLEGMFWGAVLSNMFGGQRRSRWGGGGFGSGFGGGFGGGSFGGGGGFGGGGAGGSW